MIEFDVKGSVASVTLSRKNKQNALNFLMFKQLEAAITTIKKNKKIRVVVLKGDGEHFCSGLDISCVMKSPSQILKLLFKWLPGNRNLAQQVVLGWQSLSIPVIAIINGNCFGGGLQIALGADYRIAHTQAKLAIMEARWGLCPDMGANVVLPGLVKKDQALWLSSSAEPISAIEAKKLGLITEISEQPEKTCQLLINSLLARSPDALGAIKRVTQVSYYKNERSILAKETWSQIRLLLNPNTRKAINKMKGDNDVVFNNSKRW
ncbi:MAG: crotonase/enoyl-CoA hydratase family protein [Pseudoalteromonas sp.]